MAHRWPTADLRARPNLTEGIWSLVKRDIGNLATADITDVTTAVKRRLKGLRYQPSLVDGCLTGTEFALDE